MRREVTPDATAFIIGLGITRDSIWINNLFTRGVVSYLPTHLVEQKGKLRHIFYILFFQTKQRQRFRHNTRPLNRLL